MAHLKARETSGDALSRKDWKALLDVSSMDDLEQWFTAHHQHQSQQAWFSRSDIVDHLWSTENLPTEDTIKSHFVEFA